MVITTINFILTLLCSAIVGYTFLKLRVPGGMMVGAIVGAVVLNIAFDRAMMPATAKLAAQIISGAFIGVGIEKEDLKRMNSLFKPLIILVTGMFILNMVMGFVIYYTSDLDLLTSFFCAVPGGMSDMPIISAEMGADGAMVALLQFVRLCAGIGIFPSMIQYFGRKESRIDKGTTQKAKIPYTHKGFLVAILAATVGGLMGKWTGIPAGALLFALISAMVAKQFFAGCMLPLWARRTAQVLAGAYIATGISPKDIPAMKSLFVPAILLVIGYFVTCILLGFIMKKYCGLSIKESMLAATPAGASDMALIAADIGVSSPDVVVLQVGRMLAAIMVFPQLVRYIVLNVLPLFIK